MSHLQINPFSPATGTLATCLHGNTTATKRLMGKKSGAERKQGCLMIIHTSIHTGGIYYRLLPTKVHF